MRRLGFTLVELLVVIGMIGVLAGLLFPVFQMYHRHQAGVKYEVTMMPSNTKIVLSSYVEYSGGLNGKDEDGKEVKIRGSYVIREIQPNEPLEAPAKAYEVVK